MTEKKLQPKLRFPGFEGKWVKNTIGDIGKVSMCKRIMKDQTTPEGQIPFYKIGTFGKDADAFISEEIYGEYKSKYSFPKKGDILISASGTIGRTVVYDGEPAYFQDSNIVWIDNNENIITNNFLFYLYKNVRWTTEDTTIARLYNNNLKSIKITSPSLSEQEKIASFLIDVDTQIELLEEKRDKLTEYKKGCMQRLFSGKWTSENGQMKFIPPSLRFKADDGSDFPDWEEKKLGENFDFHQTNSLSRAALNEEGGEVMNIHYGDIHTKFPSLLDVNRMDISFINEGVDISKVKSESYCKDGDVIMADASEDYKDIGKAIEIKNIGENKVVAGLHTFLLRDAKGKTVNGFKAYLFQKSYLRTQIKKIATGISVLGISKTNLGKLKISLPCLEEQQKIADFLTDIDRKIELVEQEIDQNREFKRGLLQQMFV